MRFGSAAALAIVHLIAVWLIPIGPAAGDAAADTVQVGSVERTYRTHIPSGAAPKFGWPVMLVFHGRGGQGFGIERLSAMDELADRYRFIVIYPDGIDRGWNDGRRDTGNVSDDVGFVWALLNAAQVRHGADPKRLFAAGLSNGGMMVQRLACEMAGRIAGFASVAAAMPRDLAPDCQPSRPVSMLLISGNDDPIMPFGGGKIGGGARGTVLSAAATLKFWTDHDHCRYPPETARLPAAGAPDGTAVTRTKFSHCMDGATVMLDAIEGGGHAWPGGPQYQPRALIGKASDQLNASREIAAFFGLDKHQAEQPVSH